MGHRFVKPRVSRLYLRIPKVDWPNVTQGRKTELRLYPGHGALNPADVDPPTPVVGYARQMVGPRFRLLVVESAWREPVGAISQESLEREGFKTRGEFRSYWRQRSRRAFKSEGIVWVYRLRPFRPEDRSLLADRLFEHLYGEFVDA